MLIKVSILPDPQTGKPSESSCACCAETGHCYTVEGLEDGYVDACPEHVQDIARDALTDAQAVI